MALYALLILAASLAIAQDNRGPRLTLYVSTDTSDVPGSEAITRCRIYVHHSNTWSTPAKHYEGVFYGANELYFTYEEASLDYITDIWTNCHDALLIDAAMLSVGACATCGGMEDKRMWGTSFNQYGWCVSLDPHDAQEGEWPEAVPGDICYQGLRFHPNGQTYVGDRYYHLEYRRELADVPTAEDITACENDPEFSDDDCGMLVNMIMQANNASTKKWIPVNQPSADDDEDNESKENESQENDNDDDDDSDDDDSTRRLLDNDSEENESKENDNDDDDDSDDDDSTRRLLDDDSEENESKENESKENESKENESKENDNSNDASDDDDSTSRRLRELLASIYRA